MDELITNLGNWGFSIVACIALFKVHTQTLESLKKIIYQNTAAVEKMCTLISNVIGEDTDNES